MGKSGGRKKKANADPAPKPPPVTSAAAAAAAAVALPTANGVDPDSSVFLKRAHELKEEGNRLFQSRDYAAALQQYDAGLRLLPRSHPDRAVFHSNRAACLMQVRPVDHEAVAADCSLALQAQPGFPRALLRRARALEALRRYELALQDVQALLASDPANRDALDLARRLRSVLGHPQDSTQLHHHNSPRPSPAALGASAALGAPIAGLGPCLPARPVPKKPTSPNPPPPASALPPTKAPAHPVVNGPQSTQPLPVFKPTEASSVVQSPSTTVERTRSPTITRWQSASAAVVGRCRPLKLIYDHDIRLAQMPAGCNFRVLREIVAKRFPSSKSVLVKYKDVDGDLVTITSTAELKLAELCVETKEGANAAKDESLRVLRLHIVEVAPEQEPPLPEEEEDKPIEESEGQTSGGESLSQSQTMDSVLEEVDTDITVMGPEEDAPKDKSAKTECSHTECKEAEIDDWLLEFAQLFRNQVGIDPDAHLDLHELGMELCSEALEETVTSEEAQGLFEMAAAKFQEVAALAFFNWGNVHMCTARKRIPLNESPGKELVAAQLREAYDWVRERYALAGHKYEESLRIKPDFYEGLLALGQQHFETAKLHWSFAQASKVDLTTWDSSETINLFDSAEEKMKAATEMWERVEEQRITELNDPNTSKKDELIKKRKKQGVTVDGQGELSADEAAEQAVVMKSQIHLFWGNMLFERSQVEFKLGVGDWKKNLDTAVERFRLAGASEVDISVVLKNHSSNEVGVECDEKKVVDLNSVALETNTKDEDNIGEPVCLSDKFASKCWCITINISLSRDPVLFSQELFSCLAQDDAAANERLSLMLFDRMVQYFTKSCIREEIGRERGSCKAEVHWRLSRLGVPRTGTHSSRTSG